MDGPKSNHSWTPHFIKAKSCQKPLSFNLHTNKLTLSKISISITSQLESQADQAPAVRWSSYSITVMAELWEFVWEYLRTLEGIKKYVKFSIKIPYLTFTAYYLLPDPLLWWNEPLFSELSVSRFPTYVRKAHVWTLHFRTSDPRSEKFQRKMTGRPQIQRRIQAHILWFHFNSLQTQSFPCNRR